MHLGTAGGTGWLTLGEPRGYEPGGDRLHPFYGHERGLFITVDKTAVALARRYFGALREAAAAVRARV